MDAQSPHSSTSSSTSIPARHLRPNMSTSLREKLKKCGRYHPGTPAKGMPSSGRVSSSQIAPESQLASSDNSDITKTSGTAKTTQLSLTPTRKSVNTAKTDGEYRHSEFIKRRKIIPEKVRNLGSKGDVAGVIKLSPQDKGVMKNEEVKITVNVEVNNMLNSVDVSHKDSIQSDSETQSNSKNSDYMRTDTPVLKGYAVDLEAEKRQLEKTLKAREEQLRKLKMVKMYREKNNLSELQGLIGTWKDVTQRALHDLHALHPLPRPTMTDLINHLQIDHGLVSYDPEEEAFS